MGDHWLPPSFLIYTQRYAGRFAHLKWGTGEEPVFLIHSDWIPIKIIPMMLWAQDTASILSIFDWFFIELIVYWFDSSRTSEAGNGETGPSTVSSLVGNFPCMPQSLTFTHSPEGLGPSFPEGLNPAHTPHSFPTGPKLQQMPMVRWRIHSC